MWPKIPSQSGVYSDTSGYSTNVYSCYGNNDDNSGKLDQSNITIYRSTTTTNSVNNCNSAAIYNNTYSIGSLYSQTDCSSTVPGPLSVATIVCLTFFIPLIFYIICWVIIVKIMKRGDLCAKALCLDNNNIKKNDDNGLSTQEITLNSVTDTESQLHVNRVPENKKI